MLVNSSEIKTGLLHYLRFKRRWICADEVYSGDFIADVLVDEGSFTMEIEIKISKSDLFQGEAKKTTGWRGRGKKKHEEWPTTRPNKFALCVPEYLVDDALKWIEENNKRYGLFVYKPNSFPERSIRVKKTALKLHKNYDKLKHLKKIARRLSSCRAFELSSINRKVK